MDGITVSEMDTDMLKRCGFEGAQKIYDAVQKWQAGAYKAKDDAIVQSRTYNLVIKGEERNMFVKVEAEEFRPTGITCDVRFLWVDRNVDN